MVLDADDSSSDAAEPATYSVASAQSGRTSAKDKKQKVQTASGPRIATIHNMTKSGSEDEEEQGQVDFFNLYF